MSDLEAVIRALDDIHEEYLKASKDLDKNHAGASRTADQRINLIREYSLGVSRILETFKATLTLLQPTRSI